MSRQQFTLKDISKKSGFSIATVSATINNPKIVKEETRKKIQKVIDNCNYIKDDIASSLKKRKTLTIGVIVPDISYPISGIFLKSIQKECEKNNFEVLIRSSSYDVEIENNIINKFLGRRVDGIVILSGKNHDNKIINVSKRGTPIVVVFRKLRTKKISSVLIDNKNTIFNSIEYLIKKGHKRILYFTHNFDQINTLKLGYEGFLNAIKKYDLKKYVFISNYTLTNELAIPNDIRNIIIKNKITAVFALSDLLAISLIKKLTNRDYNVPGDISVMGFGNLSISRFISPPLTTVDFSKSIIGVVAMKILINILKSNQNNVIHYILPVKIIERKSVREL